MTRDYVAIAESYARAVTSGDKTACEFVRQSCQRFLDDKRTAETNRLWKWDFDPTLAAKPCRFGEMMPHVKGRYKGTIELQPWQIFIIVNVFGFVNRETRFRRFKTAYIEVPRKNGKSTFTSVIALYTTFMEGEPGAEGYAAAVNRDQAKIVWGDAKSMCASVAPLKERFGIHTYAHAISQPHSGSSFKALSRDNSGNLDGLNVHFAALDELHGHPNRQLWDVIETGTGAREQPLMWAITTSGFDKTGICYEQRNYATKILSGTFEDDEYFGIIYTIDKEDDWTDPAVWEKANPNWGVSVKPEDIARLAKKAIETTSAQANFLTKRLNVWVNAGVAWLNAVEWKDCGQENLSIDDFDGCPCWIGVDLASKTDLASVAYLFQRGTKFYLFVDNYINEDACDESKNASYYGWSVENKLIVTEGNITDHSRIEEDIKENCKRFDVRSIGVDPHQATYLMGNLADEGLPVEKCGQGATHYNEPMREFEALVKSQDLVHNGCPVLDWAASNVVCKENDKEQIRPVKDVPENKIDPIVAALMALGRYLHDETEGPSAYENQELIII